MEVAPIDVMVWKDKPEVVDMMQVVEELPPCQAGQGTSDVEIFITNTKQGNRVGVG